jgi:hypothetical protein
MRVPSIVVVHPPNTCPIYVPVGELNLGEMFIAHPSSIPALSVIVEKPNGGLLQVLDLEEGCIQSMSHNTFVKRITTIITVVGDVIT